MSPTWQVLATRTLDAGGASVMPGFIESHLHIFSGAASLSRLDLTGVDGKDALRNAVMSWSARQPDGVIFANQAHYTILGSGPITRQILDEVCPDRPFAMEPARSKIGDAKLSRAFAWNTLRNAGAQLCFASDWPVSPVDPLLSIKAAMTRKNCTRRIPTSASHCVRPCMATQQVVPTPSSQKAAKASWSRGLSRTL